MNKKAMYKLSCGLYLVSAQRDGFDNACVTNTLTQVTADPYQVSLAVNKGNFTHDMIMDTKKFCASVISEAADFDLFKQFGFQSGRDVNKFADFTDCTRDSSGLIVVTRGTNAFVSADVFDAIDMGTHTLFLGKVTDMDVLSEEASATYDYYQQHIKPAPAAASAEDAGKVVWRCTVCGYEYEGEELPPDFVCPLCGHPASDFERVVK